MKKGQWSWGIRGFFVVGFVLASAFTIQASDVVKINVNEADVVSVDNVRDPICGMDVSKVPRANTAQYKGKTIGFCSSSCRTQWNKLSDQEKAKKIEHAMIQKQAGAEKIEYPMLAKPGTKIPIGNDLYFIYGFSSQPKMGSAIMKVEVFTRDGKRDTTCRVMGDFDMPSMRGAHTTGIRDFSVSAKGFYLLPVQLVMPGDWEMRIIFEKDGRTILRGAYLFDL
jgi:YHS domain-containing protein